MPLAESELLELTLLADMVQRLASSERGMQPTQAQSISERIRSTRDRLRKTIDSLEGSPHVSNRAPHMPLVSPGQTHLSASSDSNLPPVKHAASNTPVKAMPVTKVPQPPLPPPILPLDSQLAATSSSNPATPRGATKAPTGQSATVTAAGFQVKKPSSVRVAQIARDTPPPTSTGVNREIAKNVAASLYNVLETLTILTQSSSAHVFVRVGDEMVSIVNVGVKLSFPPKLNRHNCQGSIASGVMASGVAINQRVMEPGRPITGMLVFPIRKKIGGGAEAPTIGVLQMHNKYGGPGVFTEVDENILNIGSSIIGDMLSKFPIEWTESFYDPITQHIVAPFVPKGANSLRLEDPEGTIFITATDPSAGKKPLVEALDSFVSPQLIRRIVLPLSQNNEKAPVGLGAAPSLKEVDAYLNNLHDCWRKSVEMNINQTQLERQRSKEMKQLRDDLKVHKSKHAEVEEELRLHTLDSDDYRREYSTLKQELDEYLRLKGRID